MQESIIELIIEIEIEIDKGCSTMSISNTISIVDKIDRGCSTLHEIDKGRSTLHDSRLKPEISLILMSCSAQSRHVSHLARDKKRSYRYSYSAYLQTVEAGP
jgi:hypothetical protein